MTSETLRVLPEQLWLSGIIMALVDAAAIWLLIRRIKASHFRQLKWTITGTAAVLWSALAMVVVLAFWGTYYQHFFPSWFRSGGILLYVPVLYGILALAFHWLALRLPGNPIISFCLLGGLESLLEHLWAIYGLKILEVPLFEEADPASILAFAFPEYIFYWCIVVSVAVSVHSMWRRWTGRRRLGARAA